jgi:hypothetical protein
MKTNRRKFLTNVALASVAAETCARAASARDMRPDFNDALTKFKTHLAALPRRSGLKIQSVESLVVNNSLAFVLVKTDDGSEGIGQISPFDADISVQILHRKIAPLALGMDPYDFDAISDKCIELQVPMVVRLPGVVRTGHRVVGFAR